MPNLIGLRDDVLTSASGVGVKLTDADSTEFGWQSLVGQLLNPVQAVNGVDAAALTSFTGSASAYSFTGTALGGSHAQQFNFLLPRDFVPASLPKLLLHWSTPSDDAGNVEFALSYYAQNGFSGDPANEGSAGTATITLTPSQHVAAEVNASITDVTFVEGSTFELAPGSTFIALIVRDPDAAGDTFADECHLLHVELVYQSSNLPTKNVSPDFYA